MRRYLAVIALALPAMAGAEPITLKGLAPDMTKAQLEQTHPGLTKNCIPVQKVAPDAEVCGYPSVGGPRIEALDTLAGVPVKRWLATMRKGTTDSIMVLQDNGDFERVKAAMEQKFGRPFSVEPGEVQNRMGATFDQIKIRWSLEGRLLTIQKRSGKLDEMMILLSSEAAMRERAEDVRNRRPKADAKDM